jgi:alpha-N-acetylglucosaminidase
MEGSENNPVMFELMSELVWLTTDSLTTVGGRPFSKEEWTRRYVRARYGTDDPQIQEAWQILAGTIYNCPAGNNQQGPHESIFDARPSLNNFQVKSWSKMRNYYDPEATLRAARLMTDVAEKYWGNNNFEYDLVDIVRQALDDQARRNTCAPWPTTTPSPARPSRKTRRGFSTCCYCRPPAGYPARVQAGTLDRGRTQPGSHARGERPLRMERTRANHHMGKRTCADQGGLRDYAHKEWQGLLKDFYFVRWYTWLDALSRQMVRHAQPDPDALGGGPNASKTSSELFAMALPAAPVIDWYAIEEPWTLQHNTYSPEPEGQSVDVAREVMTFLESR